VHMYVCMYVCMYVYIYIYILYIHTFLSVRPGDLSHRRPVFGGNPVTAAVLWNMLT